MYEVVYVSGVPIGVGKLISNDIGTTHEMICNTLFDSDTEADIPKRKSQAELIASALNEFLDGTP